MSYVINPEMVPITNGDTIISANTQLAPVNAVCTGSAGSKSLSATGSFSAGQLIFIHEDTGTNYGLCEIAWVVSYTAGTITLAWNLTNTYLHAQVVVFSGYRSLTVNNGYTLSPPDWITSDAKGGIFAVSVRGVLDVASGGKLSLVGKSAKSGSSGPNGDGGGFHGGYGNISGNPAGCGESHTAGISATTSANAESGGGANGGADGIGGIAIPGFDTTLTSFFPFPGAGGGAYDLTTYRSGGNGAPIGIIIANKIRLRGADCLYGRGGDGITNQDSGAGAGSNIRIICREIIFDTTDCVNLLGGVRAVTAGSGNKGGSGANIAAPGTGPFSGDNGHIRIEACKVSGTISAGYQSISVGGYSYCGRVGKIS